MIIDPADYPYLFAESTWTWGPVKTVFQLGQPPPELVSNVNIVPFDDVGWLAIRQQIGWGIVGGTLEPGETYIDALKRELREEAGCELLSYEVFGALRLESRASAPYRSHLPHPISYRLFGVGKVRRSGVPTNPEAGERILEVGVFSLEEARRLLEQRPDDGRLLADAYRLAAAFRKK